MEEKQPFSKSIYEKTKAYTYYILIGIVSLISVIFLPMVGSEIGMGWNIPNTMTGWIVWGVGRVAIAVINVLIFYGFMEQGKLNVVDHENYVKAIAILMKTKKHKEEIPKSPTKWQASQYGKKGTTIFFSSALSVMAFSQAILSYEWSTMLAFIFTIVMGIVFGIMQMRKSEAYWSLEFYEYALMIEEQEKSESAQAEVSVTTEEE